MVEVLDKRLPDGRTLFDAAWRLQVQIEFARAGMMAEHDAWKDCQNPDTTRCHIVCPTDPAHYHRPVRNTCHLRVCPECARRDAGRLLARYLPAMKKVVAQKNRAYRLKHIVLTTALSLDHPDLPEKLRYAYSCVGRLFDLYFGKSWVRRGMGYIVAAEFGELGMMLHFHLLFYGPFMVKQRLSDLWKQLTGYHIVHVKALLAEQGDMASSAAEVLKYATKLTHLRPQYIPLLLSVLKGTRRIRSRGVFYNMAKADERERVCPDCGATLARWSPFRWAVWRDVHREFVEGPDYYQLGMLDLIRGNKSGGATTAEIGAQHAGPQTGPLYPLDGGGAQQERTGAHETLP